MTLSIICPTYNEELYISKTIQSFLNQKITSFDLEILICDGMSTDKTREIVTNISKDYPSVRLLDNKKRKTPFAFNIGLREAKGDFVAILGAHSEYDEDYLQVCFEKLHEFDAVGCSGKIVTKAINDSLQSKICEWVSLSSFGVSSRSFRVLQEGYVDSIGYPVFRKQPLLDIGGYNEELFRNQDNDMNQRLLDTGYKLYLTSKTKAFYHPPSTISKLIKYAYNNGFWNAKSLFIHRKSMRLHHFIPFVFVLTFLLLSICGFVEFFFNHTNYIILLLALMVLLHLTVGLIATLFVHEKKHYLSRIFVMPFVFWGFHFAYGWGTTKSLVQKFF